MTKLSDQPKLLKDIVDSLSQAANSAGVLTHSLRDPRWMIIRESLDLAKEGVTGVATFAAKLTKVRPN